MRAGIYLRISQDHERTHEGIDRQRDDCLDLAEKLGWQVVAEYPDNDASATMAKPRPHYQRMLADIRAGRIDAIIAWHSDRLYRKLTDLEELADLCAQYKVSVRTCRAGEIDMSTPTGRMVAEILGSVAQHEVRQKADRWLRSVRQRREAGRWWNSANRMFGYTRDGRLIDREAAILRRAAADILAGSTVHGVCRWLQAEGVKTTRGNDFQPTSLRQTLRSPKIAGLSALGGEIIGPGDWEPVLDRQTWEKVVAAIATRRHQRPNPRRALLTGLVFCGVDGCGRKLVRTKNDRLIYRCQTELKASGHVAVGAVPLERMVESYAREMLSDPDVRAAVSARLAGADETAAELTREIDRLDGEIRELQSAPERTGRSRLAVASWIDELDEQLRAKRAALSRLTPAAVPAVGEWPSELDQRAAAVALVVGRVVVYPATRPGRFDRDRIRIDPA